MLLLARLAGCGGTTPDAQFNGRSWTSPTTSPTIALTATDGAPYSLASDREKPLTLVFFGYTHCPDLCPMVLGSLSSGLTKLDDADRERVEVVLVTTDPRATPSRCCATTSTGSTRPWRGSPASSTRSPRSATRSGSTSTTARSCPRGGYDLGGHSTSVVGIDETTRPRSYWDQDTSPAEFASDIHTLLNEDE